MFLYKVAVSQGKNVSWKIFGKRKNTLQDYWALSVKVFHRTLCSLHDTKIKNKSTQYWICQHNLFCLNFKQFIKTGFLTNCAETQHALPMKHFQSICCTYQRWHLYKPASQTEWFWNRSRKCTAINFIIKRSSHTSRWDSTLMLQMVH